MKIIFRTAALAALIITASCGKDDSPDVPGETDQIAEQQEQTPLETNLVADNVVIAGGDKITGTPPTPNEAISLDISDAGKTAFLNEGFYIPFSSDGDVVGAYLQFKSNDGTVADSYYDINVSTNSTGKAIPNKIKSKKGKLSHTTKVNDGTLDVDFNTQIEPGTFCYVVCVYDAQGNISAPEEVCVTVESWGGNAEVVGTWTLVRQYFDSSPEEIELPNIDMCETQDAMRSCAQGALNVSYNYESCERIEYFEITMKSDGTYTERYKDISSTTINSVDIPDGVTLENLTILCDGFSFSDSEAILTYDGDGYWSYINDEDRFVFIEYNYEEVYDGETYSESYGPGDGGFYYGSSKETAVEENGEVQIVDGKLIISSFEFRTSELEKR